MDWRDWAAGALITAGTFFFLTGTIGVLRMPDVYTRLHVAAKSDSLGAGLWLLGMALIAGSTAVAIKLVVLTVFVWVTSPTAAHSMARAAYRTGVMPVPGTATARDPRQGEAPDLPGTRSASQGSEGSGHAAAR
jgi:multicomponent Na+:H+ antiporter subunit G